MEAAEPLSPLCYIGPEASSPLCCIGQASSPLCCIGPEASPLLEAIRAYLERAR